MALAETQPVGAGGRWLTQFPEDEELEISLDVDEEVLKTKFEGKLHPSYEGPSADVFCKVGALASPFLHPATSNVMRVSDPCRTALKPVQ